MIKLLNNPLIASLCCLVLFVFMYSHAHDAFTKFCSLFPLAVVVGIVLKAIYMAYIKK